MEDQKQTSFTFEIDNFSYKEALVKSPTFSSGGCEWYVKVYPKGDILDDQLAMYLCVANPESLRLGWKRRASYSFVLLNTSGKELFRKYESCPLFCAQFSGRGTTKSVPLKDLQEKGFLEKNKLRVKVEVKVVEVVDQGVVTGNETFDFNGFQILYSQFISVSRLFVEHPGIAVNIRPKSKPVKTTYMNLLLNLIELLNKPPHSFTETDLSNAQSELIDLTEVGFKLDWLKTKLDEVFLERKKTNAADGSRVQELEEHIKNLKVELNEEKVKSATSGAKVLSLEQTVWDLKDEVSDLKVVVSDLINVESEDSEFEDEVSDLKDELNKNEAKSDTCAAHCFSWEQTVSDLQDEHIVFRPISKMSTLSDLQDELNKVKDKSDTCAAKVLSLEQMVLSLKEKSVVGSWEVLDYADLHNEK
ncbi:unnamed protein product [Microthlaspi erraticum]|uniref:MATH domain-containing protein n=1 Tax=Microthlaspi erraticum TaxID=1685480 RepID=A0A6D2IR63_9BRAS|nr:unnamed protein product [Microthlaspi erraticum]